MPPENEPEITKAKRAGQRKKSPPKPLGPMDKNPTERSVARSTRVIAVFTCVLAVVAFIQAWAFMQSERSFISVEEIGWSGAGLVPNQDMFIVLKMKNSGESAASIDSFAMVEAEKPGVMPLFPGPLGAAVPAGGTLRNRFGIDNKPIRYTAKEVELIKNGARRLYVYGFIHYSDVFWFPFGPAVTGFCYVYEPNPGVFSVCIEPGFTYTSRHWASPRQYQQEAQASRPPAGGPSFFTRQATPDMPPPR